MFIYIYEDHTTGNYFTRDYELTDDFLYCEQCGESDQLIEYGQPKALLDKYLNQWTKIIENDPEDSYEYYEKENEILNILKAISPYLSDKREQ